MNRVVVILCGGQGRRLGTLGEKLPKAMAKVSGLPILWFAIMQLHAAGFRHFILPLGYRGEQIQGYIDRELNWLSARIDAVQTGQKATIGQRLHKVQHLLPDGPFLLVNGDCLFDLDFDAFYHQHFERKALASLSACRVTSQFGLFVVNDSEIVSFSRNASVRSFNLETDGGNDLTGYVNAGITLIERAALDRVDLLHSDNFEIDLFSRLIADQRIEHMMIDGYWYAIETQKDLDIAHGKDTTDPRGAGALLLRESLMRYQAALELGYDDR